MTDPLGELEDALYYMFELQHLPLDGRYINPRVENLRAAIDGFKEDPSKLSELVSAFSDAQSVIENYVDTYKVKQKIQALLALQHGVWQFNLNKNEGNEFSKRE